MAKVTNLGWAKPTDPVYKTGLIVSRRLLKKSKLASQDSTAGQPPPLDLQNLPFDPVTDVIEETARGASATRNRPPSK